MTAGIIVLGYVALIAAFGWPGLAVGAVHVLVLLAAGWRPPRK